MKRKAILSVLCVLICLIAMSPSSSAATCYSDSVVGVLPSHADVDAEMKAFDDVTGQPLDPEWEWNNNRWECDFTAQGAPPPPAQISINVRTIWHDFCDPHLSNNIKGWVKLTVNQVAGPPPQFQDSVTWDFNQGNWYLCDGSPQIFVNSNVCQINVAGQQGKSYDLEVEIEVTLQGVQTYNDGEWGRLIT